MLRRYLTHESRTTARACFVRDREYKSILTWICAGKRGCADLTNSSENETKSQSQLLIFPIKSALKMIIKICALYLVDPNALYLLQPTVWTWRRTLTVRNFYKKRQES